MDAFALAARLDYGFLNLAARLPRPVALACCAIRALLRFSLDLEWRSYALKRRYVRSASARAYAQLQSRPSGMISKLQRAAWVLGRFWVESVEEFDVIRLDAKALDAAACTIQGLIGLDHETKSQGLVLLTAHLESLYLPLCHLAAQGRPIYVAASQIVEDPQVPAPIRAHFQRKKEVLERHLGKDHVVYVEQGMQTLARALQRGAIVVIACDSPAPKASRGIKVQFLGRFIAMAQGPRFLAVAGRAQVALMNVKRFGFWQYQMDIYQPQITSQWSNRSSSPPLEQSPDDDVDRALQAAYAALDRVIRNAPWKWWAADLVLKDIQP